MIAANNPNLKSWVSVPENSDFPIQNLPFGIIGNHILSKRVSVRIGDYALDLKVLAEMGFLKETGFDSSDFDTPFLNPMMKKENLQFEDCAIGFLNYCLIPQLLFKIILLKLNKYFI